MKFAGSPATATGCSRSAAHPVFLPSTAAKVTGNKLVPAKGRDGFRQCLPCSPSTAPGTPGSPRYRPARWSATTGTRPGRRQGPQPRHAGHAGLTGRAAEARRTSRRPGRGRPARGRAHLPAAGCGARAVLGVRPARLRVLAARVRRSAGADGTDLARGAACRRVLLRHGQWSRPARSTATPRRWAVSRADRQTRTALDRRRPGRRGTGGLTG